MIKRSVVLVCLLLLLSLPLGAATPAMASARTLRGDPTEVKFGHVSPLECCPVAVVTITNTGPAPVTLTAIQVFGGSFGLVTSISSNVCLYDSFSLAPGDSCTMGVVFGWERFGPSQGELLVEVDSTTVISVAKLKAFGDLAPV